MADKLTAGSGSSPRRRSGRKAAGKVLVALAVLAVMVVAVAGVFYLAGGADLIASAASSSSPVLTAVASTVPTLPAGVDENLAKRMYAEQVESHSNLALLAQGQFSWFTIDKVQIKQVKGSTDSTEAALVSITSRLKDGTGAPGVLLFTRHAGNWYLFTMTGLRPASTAGLAEVTNAVTSLQASRTPAAILVDSGTGVTTFDEGVMGTIASGQAANQDVVARIMNRSVRKLTLGKPEVGVNTVSVPVTFSGTSAETTGSLVLIQKTIDGTDLDFLTSFSKQ